MSSPEEGLFANVACSMDPGVPVTPGHVRLSCPYMVTHLERSEEDPNRTHLSTAYQIDFGGDLPTIMKEFINLKRVRLYEKMKADLKALSVNP